MGLIVRRSIIRRERGGETPHIDPGGYAGSLPCQGLLAAFQAGEIEVDLSLGAAGRNGVG